MTTSKIYVFTYGSLLNLASLARTLGRELEPCALTPARLKAHRVIWGYETGLNFNGEAANGIFLTLIKDAHSSSIGAVFAVNADEFENLKKREAGYDVLEFSADDFENLRLETGVKIYAFGTLNPRNLSGVIPQKYIELLQTAVDRFDENFRREYENSVLKNLPFEIKHGEYSFANSEQNAYAKGKF